MKLITHMHHGWLSDWLSARWAAFKRKRQAKAKVRSLREKLHGIDGGKKA